MLIGIGVSCAVLSGIMGFYLASSRLMFSMSRDGYLPEWFSVIDNKYGTPRNAIIFCILVSLSGPVLGREALGWFVDMSAIGASTGFFFTCVSILITTKKRGDGTPFLKITATAGTCFSVIFMILQLIPIPGLSGVHFCKESYLMLIAWILIGVVFYAKQWKYFRSGNWFSCRRILNLSPSAVLPRQEAFYVPNPDKIKINPLQSGDCKAFCSRCIPPFLPQVFSLFHKKAR